MNKFDVTISVGVTKEGGYQGQLINEYIVATGVPTKLVYTLLTWIFKLTEGYTAEK